MSADSETKKRGSCWCIVVNNPTEADRNPTLPPGWVVEGQEEVGKDGTPHLQLMLKCGRTEWFNSVKRVYPRAHIEKARDQVALQNYVHKPDTRVAEYENRGIPSIFEYQKTIASRWDPQIWEFRVISNSRSEVPSTIDDLAMEYIDHLTAVEIEGGQEGAEWISINPMWRCSWKKFWKSIILREQKKNIRV